MTHGMGMTSSNPTGDDTGSIISFEQNISFHAGWALSTLWPEHSNEVNINANLQLAREFKDSALKKMNGLISPFIAEFEYARVHPESIIQLRISEKEGRQIASFAFFCLQDTNGRTLYINNIQGRRYGSETGQSPLKELSEVVKDNWRVWIAGFLKDFGQERDMRVIGVLPPRDLLQSTPEEYARQLRQYLQAFRKAGIKDVDSSLVPDENGASMLDTLDVKSIHGLRDVENIRKRLRNR